MVAKSIVQIDVDDAAFLKFKALYDQYQASLKKLPGAWGNADAAIKSTGVSFTEMTAALLAQAELTRQMIKNQEKQEKTVRTTARLMGDMARDTASVARNLISATTSLLKWAGLTGVFTGLIGAGGLFGIERLAQSAGGYRREGFGIGATPGELRAFETQYGKYVDPTSFLTNINAVTSDLSKQWGLGGEAAAMARQGKDSAQIAVDLIPKMVDQFIAWGGLQGRGAQAMAGLGLDRFGSLQDFERLARSRGELGASAAAYRHDVEVFGTSDRVSKAWQDFTIKLEEAGQKIETTFITGLAPLAPNLGKLSEAVSDALKKFLDNPNLGKDIDAFADGIGKAAKFIGSEEFDKDVKSFADNVAALAESIVRALRWLGAIPDPNAAPNPGGTVAQLGPLGSVNRIPDDQLDPVSRWVSRRFFGARDSASVNNAFGLTMPGSGNFRSFNSFDDSVKAAYGQIERDIKVHHLSTLKDLISDPTWGWAPEKDRWGRSTGNDDTAYLASIARDTGYMPDTKLDASDIRQIAAILAAQSKVEQPKHAYTPDQVIRVLNQTGGSAVISTNQVAQ